MAYHLERSIIIILRRLSFFLGLSLIILFSCSKDEIKRPSQEAIIAKEAMDIVNSIKDAYMANDDEKLKQLINSEQVFQSISLSERPASLEFLFRWVDIFDSKVDVYVSWKGLWKKGPEEVEQKGFALFVLEGKPFKLKKILRENPFLLQTLP